jgi:hypothetical protein
VLVEGRTNLGTVKRTGPVDQALAVSLAVSDPSALIVPSPVTIGVGQASATFPVSAPADGTKQGSRAVTVTATAPGYANCGPGVVIVTDEGLPDLVVEGLSAPAKTNAGSRVTVSYRVRNQGLGSVTNDFVVRVYLSRDGYVGEDELIGEAPFTYELTAGQHFDQAQQVELPVRGGAYWLVVVVDAAGAVAEVAEQNNTALVGIQVEQTYSVQVWTAVEVAPAGTPIPLQGRAVYDGSGEPAANEPVWVHLKVGRFPMVLRGITTGADGTFTNVYRPSPREAGRYDICATPPGVARCESQDSFTLLGVRFMTNRVSHTLVGLSALTNYVWLENLGTEPIGGLSVSVAGVDSNHLAVVAEMLPILPGLERLPVGYSIQSLANEAYRGQLTLRVDGLEGVWLELPIEVRVEPGRPRLVASPASLSAAMVRGSQRMVEFEVRNEGGAESGPLSVVLPEEATWLSVVSSPVPSIPAGGSARVTLQLLPAANLPLGPYSGWLVVAGTDVSLNVPFEFQAISEGRGGLRVTAVDEFTYYAEGAPKVTNALVRLLDPFTQAEVIRGNTGWSGEVVFTNLLEAYYRVEVSAEGHDPYRATILLMPGRLAHLLAFLPRHLVTYTWVVTPTEVPDRYTFRLETTFETYVPVPVVTVEPASIDLSRMTEQTNYVELKIRNHGLVKAQNLVLYFGAHARWRLTPLVRELGDLGPLSEVSVPLLIERGGTEGAADGCQVEAHLDWFFPCGPQNRYFRVPIVVFNASEDCVWWPPYPPPSPPAHWPSPGPGCPECGAPPGEPISPCTVGCSADRPHLVVPKFELNVDLCNPCAWAVGSCGLSVVGGPIAEVISVWELVLDCLIEPEWAACLEDLAGQIPGLGQALTAKDCVCNIAESCLSQTTAGRFVAQQCAVLDGWAEAALALLGNPVWLRQDPVDQAVFESFWSGFSASTTVESEAGARISEAELAALLVLARPRLVGSDAVSALAARWNRTLDYRALGITNLTQLSEGMSADFIALDRLQATWASARVGLEANLAAGYPNLYDAALTAVALARAESAPQEGVCARVGLRLDQQVVLTRDAFNGTLEIDNRSGSLLTDISVSIEIRDGAQVLANDLFGIGLIELSGLSGVDGGGMLLGNARGRAVWMIVPTPQAAWDNATEYFIGGTLSYVQEGRRITVPLFPARVEVWPTARLQMHYFLEREVYSDDPFTEAIEPAEPFALGLLVHNAGGGSARNMTMTTSEPYITDNERGLLVDFRILSAQVCDQLAASALTLSLGDVGPGATTVATWWLSASLQGRFMGLEASYQHLDDLGNPNLTLVESLQTHDLIHVVQDERPGSDTCPDYLVDEVADLNGLADTLYLSDGTVAPVTALTEASLSGAPSGAQLTVLLTVAMPSGWGYLRVADPGQGAYRLVAVRRTNDNSALLLGKNVWTTHRTVRPLGQAPRREDRLHLVDYEGAGAYWLVYEPIPIDTMAPTSQVAALPAASYPQIPVSWSGQDNARGSGIAYYNIFVSSNGGSFVLWQSQTRQSGATFLGTNGSSYAFYSVAVDRAGNQEEPPGTPDAQTTVSLTNRAPWLEEIADITVGEGDVLTINCVATNAESPPQTLTFSLTQRPPGAIIDAETGVLSWPTGEAHGDGTYPFEVCVTDNGLPPLSAYRSFTVFVQDSNSPPVLMPIPLQVVTVGKLLVVSTEAFDPDIPKQNLRFSLGQVSASDAFLDPNTGKFVWRPVATSATPTNQFEIIVADDGNPSLSATQRLSVIVNDFLALGLGRTTMLVGESNGVFLTVHSSAGVTEIESRLYIPPGHLTQVHLEPVGETVCSATVVGDATNGEYRLRVVTCPGKRLLGTEDIGWLGFTALPSPSAFVPLVLSNIVAYREDRTSIADVVPLPGRVVVVGENPLLEGWLGTNQQPMLTLYGQPGASYQITWTNRLDAWTSGQVTRTNQLGDLQTNTWSEACILAPAWEVSMAGLEAAFAIPDTYGWPSFYSAYQIDPPVVATPRWGRPEDLWLFGLPGETYRVETTTDLSGSEGWTTLTTLTLTNSMHRLEGTATNAQQRLFRALKQ